MITSLSVLLALQAAKKPAPAAPEIPEIKAPVEVPFKTTDSAIIVDALVNGKNLSFMFDTGFSAWITCDAGINLGKPDGTMNLRDFVGTFSVDTVSLKSLKLGNLPIPIKGKDATAVLRPGEDHTTSYGIHCDGIMGFAVISDFITEINFEKKKFIFYPKSYDILKKPVDNQKTFLAKLLPTGADSMELSVEVEGKGDLHLALDTGNGFFATTHKECLDRIGVWPIAKKPTFSSVASVASGQVETFNFKMPPSKIFGVPVQDTIWSIIDLPSSGADSDGTVGFQFLKNFNITIDMQKRRVHFERWTDKIENDPVGETGMACFWDEKSKRYVVGYVFPGGPAAKAGIKVFDNLLSVNGDEAINIGYQRMKAKLDGPIGSKVKLVLSRKGELLRTEVERISMVNTPPK
jgi:hypothetical protein